MDLYLVRHGESIGNRDHRVQYADTRLTEAGLAQAEATGAWLVAYFAGRGVRPAALYSSDLARAWTTAQIIGRHLDLTPQPDPRLREKYAGEAEGRLFSEMFAAYPELGASWHELPNWEWGWPDGETRGMLRDRVVAAIEAIRARHAPGDQIVIVTHGGPIWAYLSSSVEGTPPDLTEASWHIANCSVTHVHIPTGPDDTPGAACLLALNQHAHLEE